MGFWLGIIIVFGPKLDMQTNRILIFFATILAVYLLVDCIKIVLAKQLKSKLTPQLIYKVKRAISVIMMVFGIGLIAQGFFPADKEKIQQAIEKARE